MHASCWREGEGGIFNLNEHVMIKGQPHVFFWKLSEASFTKLLNIAQQITGSRPMGVDTQPIGLLPVIATALPSVFA